MTFCDLVVSSEINFKTYYILFHKPLKVYIFYVIFSDYFKKKSEKKRNDKIHVFYKKTSHTRLYPSYPKFHTTLACPHCSRMVRLFFTVENIKFQGNLENKSFFTDFRDCHGIGKYLTAHVILTGFTCDSKYQIKNDFIACRVRIAREMRDKITLDARVLWLRH